MGQESNGRCIKRLLKKESEEEELQKKKKKKITFDKKSSYCNVSNDFSKV